MIQVVVYNSKADKAEIVAKIDKFVERIILVKVGNNDRPAEAEDIEDMAKVMESALRSENAAGDLAALVTHHAVQIENIYIKE